MSEPLYMYTHALAREDYECAVCGGVIRRGTRFLRREIGIDLGKGEDPMAVHATCGPPPAKPLRAAPVTSRVEPPPARRKRPDAL